MSSFYVPLLGGLLELLALHRLCPLLAIVRRRSIQRPSGIDVLPTEQGYAIEATKEKVCMRVYGHRANSLCKRNVH